MAAYQSWRAIGPKPQGGCFLLVRGEARVERLECVEHRLVGVGVDVDECEAVEVSSEQVGEWVTEVSKSLSKSVSK